MADAVVEKVVIIAAHGPEDKERATLPFVMATAAQVTEAGGKLLVCTPCIQERRLEKSMLVDGAELIAGARVIQEVTTASAVLNY